MNVLNILNSNGLTNLIAIFTLWYIWKKQFQQKELIEDMHSLKSYSLIFANGTTDSKRESDYQMWLNISFLVNRLSMNSDNNIREMAITLSHAFHKDLTQEARQQHYINLINAVAKKIGYRSIKTLITYAPKVLESKDQKPKL